MVEDVPPQHAAEAQSEPEVQPDRRAVEHLPEPEQRLANGELCFVDAAEVLRLERDVLWVEGQTQDVARQFAGQRDIGFAAVRPAQVELVKLVAHDFRAPLGRAVPVELLVKEADPAAKDFFGLGCRMGLIVGAGWGLGLVAIRVWTINQAGRIREFVLCSGHARRR